MHRYSVYGKCLVSEVELPQLNPADASTRPGWALRVEEGREAPMREPIELGEEVIGEITIRLFRHQDGFRVDHQDTGCFDVSADGREICWYRRPDVDRDILCADVTGRVLATALHPEGRLVLHGSAVVLPDGGATFLAPKGFGKSTIAMALVAAGARLASDDTAILELGEPVIGWPGLGSLRLWQRTAEALGVENWVSDVGAGGKLIIGDLAREKVVAEPFVQSAIYVLSPFSEGSEDRPAVERVRMNPVASVLSLVPHTTLGSLLGHGPEAPVVLRLAADVARRVPVYSLQIARDLGRLSEVVEQIFAWHGGVPSETPLVESVAP
jgi:hypothetical protein